MKRVAVGLSGGVDSAVAAALLREQGYEVTGVFMICYRGPGCRTDEDRKDALDVALKLKIPFEVLDFRKAYQERVLDYFRAEYEAGRTPNPDVMCNREIKFGLFFDEMIKKRGFDYIATGHYAQIAYSQQPDLDVLDSQPQRRGSGSARQSRVCWLKQSVDMKKDQTYFLYQLRGEQLQHILFPLGEMTKAGVRAKARELKLPVAEKPDSQGICFVGEVPVKEFLKKMGVKEKVGEVVNREGKVIGSHKGVWFYTMGQRHGFRVTNDSNQSEPLFVIEKKMASNQLVVGVRAECMREEFEIGQVHWIAMRNQEQVTGKKKLKVRIRHGGELMEVQKVRKVKKVLQVKLGAGVFGVAAGQAAVFYLDTVVLGGWGDCII